MEYNIIYLSGGGRQKSYLAAARRVIWRPPEELSGGRHKLSGGRQIIIWRSPEELSGGRQKSYEGQSKLLSVF